MGAASYSSAAAWEIGRLGLRVMLVTAEFPPDIGGIGSHVAELARALTPLTELCAVVHPSVPGAVPIAGETRGFEIFRPAVIRAEPIYQWMLRPRLRRLLRAGRFDLVHVHGMRPLNATRGVGVPAVFTNHSSGFLARLSASDRRKQKTAREMAHVAHLIAPSDELVEAAQTLGYRGPADMIPNGVDPARFSPGGSAFRARAGIGPDEIVIVLARRLVEKNGVIWFARALAELRQRPFRAVIAGDGPERAAMQAILSDAGLLDRVLFLGSVANSEMTDLYRAADLSVLPSLAEATSIAGLEAMACGLPLVGTSVGGIPAIIDDGTTGLLVPARDATALARAMGSLMTDAALRRRFGAAARARVEKEFSWRAIAERTVDVYRATLADPAR
jgi:glycosyltransferase involved in cell wall biosynthesis